MGRHGSPTKHVMRDGLTHGEGQHEITPDAAYLDRVALCVLVTFSAQNKAISRARHPAKRLEKSFVDFSRRPATHAAAFPIPLADSVFFDPIHASHPATFRQPRHDARYWTWLRHKGKGHYSRPSR